MNDCSCCLLDQRAPVIEHIDTDAFGQRRPDFLKLSLDTLDHLSGIGTSKA